MLKKIQKAVEWEELPFPRLTICANKIDNDAWDDILNERTYLGAYGSTRADALWQMRDYHNIQRTDLNVCPRIDIKAEWAEWWRGLAPFSPTAALKVFRHDYPDTTLQYEDGEPVKVYNGATMFDMLDPAYHEFLATTLIDVYKHQHMKDAYDVAHFDSEQFYGIPWWHIQPEHRTRKVRTHAGLMTFDEYSDACKEPYEHHYCQLLTDVSVLGYFVTVLGPYDTPSQDDKARLIWPRADGCKYQGYGWWGTWHGHDTKRWWDGWDGVDRFGDADWCCKWSTALRPIMRGAALSITQPRPQVTWGPERFGRVMRHALAATVIRGAWFGPSWKNSDTTDEFAEHFIRGEGPPPPTCPEMFISLGHPIGPIEARPRVAWRVFADTAGKVRSVAINFSEHEARGIPPGDAAWFEGEFPTSKERVAL